MKLLDTANTDPAYSDLQLFIPHSGSLLWCIKLEFNILFYFKGNMNLKTFNVYFSEIKGSSLVVI